MKKFIAILLTLCIFASLNIVSVFALTSGGITPRAGSDETSLLENVSASVTQNDNPISAGGQLSNEPIDVVISFKVPVKGDGGTAYIEKNDTAAIDIATGFLLPDNAGPFTLKSNGVSVGTLTFEGSSALGIKASIAFDGDIKVFDGTYDNVNCTVNVELKYDGTGTNGDEGNHNVTILGSTYTVAVPPLPTTVDSTKTGTVNGQFIDWVVKITAEKGTVDGDISGYKFSDNIAKVGTYVDGSFKIGNDDIINNAVGVTPVPPTDTKLEHIFKANTTGTRYIFFSTKTADTLYFTNPLQTIENTAQIHNGSTLASESKGKVTFENKWIEKAVANIDHTTGVISWTITANTVGATLPDAIITDVLDNKLKWQSATLQENINGIWTSSSTIFSTEPVDGKYLLGTISAPVMLTLTAKIDVTLDLEHTVQNVENTAKLDWTDSPGVGSGTIRSGIGLNPINKRSSKYDVPTHQVSWTVSVEKSDMNDDLRVVELLVYANSFDKTATYSIDNSGSDALTQISSADLALLTPSFNQKYTATSFSPDSTSNLAITVRTVTLNGKAVADILIITMPNFGGIDVTSKTQTFAFKTTVTNPDIYLGNKSQNDLRNTATLLSAGALVNSSGAQINCPSSTMEKDTLSFTDAQKDLLIAANANASPSDKSFNYEDKSVVYRLHINASGIVDVVGGPTAVADALLGNATITDTLPQGWEFVDIARGEKYLAYEGTGNGSKVTATTLLTSPAFITADFDTIGTAEFTFTQLGKPYMILLKARPTTETASELFNVNASSALRNTAKLEVENWNGNANDFEDVTIKRQVLSKTKAVAQAGILNWTVDYNPYDIAYSNTIVVDTIPQGLDLRTDAFGVLDTTSITVHELSVSPDGTTTQGTSITDVASYISYDPTTRVLSFTFPNTTSGYRIKYITDITGSNRTNLTNSVKFAKGHSGTSGVSANHQISTSDVSATMQRSGWVEITKKNSANVVLAGAEFAVLTADGKAVLRSGVTDASGILTLRGLPEGDYILKETVAPIGYSLSNKVYHIKAVKSGNTVTASIVGQTGANANKVDIVNLIVGTIGSLSISKTLQGNAVDYQKAFDFEISVIGATGDYPYVKNGNSYGTITFVSGKASFALKGNDTIIIQDLPQAAAYTVSEGDYSALGYTTTKTNDTGTILADNTLSISFVNSKNTSPSSSSSPSNSSSESSSTPSVSPALGSVPKTGQSNYTLIWTILLILSAICLLFIICRAYVKAKRK